MPSNRTWAESLALASQSVVQIRILTTRTLDDTAAGPSVASGFIVSPGLILSNRHVVGTAPQRVRVVFPDEQELDATQVWVDPIHDFGVLQFQNNAGMNASALKLNTKNDSPLKSNLRTETPLKLNPRGCTVGTQVRVIGNDFGEKLVVLSGTISRVDRNPPEYGRGGYQDVNTFYVTALCDTSGGSSGSPVLNLQGEVVALNAAGASQAASSFFLPLDRVVPALEKIAKALELGGGCEVDLKKAVPRGSLGGAFLYTPMAQCARLGVSAEEETKLRGILNEGGTNLLVLTQILKEGPLDVAGFMPGDVLMSIDLNALNDFVELDALLDSRVGQTVRLEMKRGPNLLIRDVLVDDAYKAVPNEFIEYDNSIIAPISFSMALAFGLPMGRRVVVECAAGNLGPSGLLKCILLQIDNLKIETMDDLQHALCSYANQTTVRVTYHPPGSCTIESSIMLIADRKWAPMMRVKRSPLDYSLWTYVLCPNSSPSRPFTLQSQIPSSLVPKMANTTLNAAQQRVVRSMVLVEFRAPTFIDGQSSFTAFSGTGFVIDRKRGLVLVDRNTIVSAIGDVYLVMAWACVITGSVVWLHPTQNYAIVKYDPSEMIWDENETSELAPVEDLELFSAWDEEAWLDFQHDCPNAPREVDIRHGDELTFIGMTTQRRVDVLSGIRVVGFERASVLTSITPRFAAKNFDLVEISKKPTLASYGGVLVDKSGRARCFWWSFSHGDKEESKFLAVLTTPIASVIRQVINYCEVLLASPLIRPPVVYSLGCEYGMVKLHVAMQGYKLNNEWVNKFAMAADLDMYGSGHGTREVFSVYSMLAGSHASHVLRCGDLILAVEGKAFVNYDHADRLIKRAVEVWARRGEAPDSIDGKTKQRPTVSLTVLSSSGVLKNIHVEPVEMSGLGTMRLIYFCGLQLQHTHDAAKYHGWAPKCVSKGKPGVFVSLICKGSPAHDSGLSPVNWITEIDETAIDDLDDFLRACQRYRTGDVIRVRSFGWQGEESLKTIRVDLHHWPTTETRFDDSNQSWNASILNRDD